MSLFGSIKKAAKTGFGALSDTVLTSGDALLSSFGAGDVIKDSDYSTSIGKSLNKGLNYYSDFNKGILDTELGLFGMTNVIKKGDYSTKFGKGFDKQSAIYAPTAGKIAAGVVGTIYGGPAGGSLAMTGMSAIQSATSGVNANMADIEKPKSAFGRLYTPSNSYTSSSMSYYKNGGSGIEIPAVESIDQMNNDVVAGGRLAKLSSNYAIAIGRKHTDNPLTSGIQMPNSGLEVEGGEGVLQNGDGTIDVISNNGNYSAIANELGSQIGTYETAIKGKLSMVSMLQTELPTSATHSKQNTINREVSNAMADVEKLKGLIDLNTTQIKTLANAQPQASSTQSGGMQSGGMQKLEGGAYQYRFDTSVDNLIKGNPVAKLEYNNTLSPLDPKSSITSTRYNYSIKPISSKSSTLTSGLGSSSKLTSTQPKSLESINAASGSGTSDFGGIGDYISLIATGAELIGNAITTEQYAKKKIPRGAMVQSLQLDPNVDVSATVAGIKSSDKNVRDFVRENVSNSQFGANLITKSSANTASQLARVNEYKTNAEKQIIGQNIQSLSQTNAINAAKTDEYNQQVYNRDIQAMSMRSGNLSSAVNRTIEFDNNRKLVEYQNKQLAILGEQSRMQTGADATAYAMVAMELQANPNLTLDELIKKNPSMSNESLTRAFKAHKG